MPLIWGTMDAEEWRARKKFEDEIGPCPNCGAAAIVEVTTVTRDFSSPPIFLAQPAECSDRCWEEDLDGYLAAVHGRPT